MGATPSPGRGFGSPKKRSLGLPGALTPLGVGQLRRRFAAGDVKLELQNFPVPPGGEVAGVVVLGKAVKTSRGAQLSLACERTTTVHDGNKSSTSTDTAWSEDEVVGADEIADDGRRRRIPVRFILPADGPVSGSGGALDDTEVRWRLRVRVPGTAVDATFEIPVFTRQVGGPPPS